MWLMLEALRRMGLIHKGAIPKRKSDIQRIEARAAILVRVLEEIAERKLTFLSKKRLLIYVAAGIEDAEKLALQGSVPDGLVAVADKAAHVSVSGLYKSEFYSAIVDTFILENPQCVINKSRRNVRSDAKLRLQCSRLSNECARLAAELNEANSQLIELELTGGKIASHSGRDEVTSAYFAIDALIEEFGSFLKFDSSGVFLDNVLQRRIIGMDVIKGYLEWKQKEIKPSTPRRK